VGGEVSLPLLLLSDCWSGSRLERKLVGAEAVTLERFVPGAMLGSVEEVRVRDGLGWLSSYFGALKRLGIYRDNIWVKIVVLRKNLGCGSRVRLQSISKYHSALRFPGSIAISKCMNEKSSNFKQI
jgi:hypothetical protein